MVKRLSFFDRLRAAWRAFKGSKVGSLHFGVEVKRCDECDKVNPPDVLYLCDRKQCDNGCYWECNHTQDINHAINFKKCEGDRGPYFVEIDPEDKEENL